MVDKQRRMAHTTKVGTNARWMRRAQTGKRRGSVLSRREPDQWDALLDQSTLWRTFPVTAWTL